MQMNTGMSDKNRQEVGDALAYLLADTYAIYLKTQNFHWNLSEAEFYSLHILFEKQYQELAEAIDEIAERIRALGFYVDGSFTGFLKLTSIKDSEQIIPIQEMLLYLLQGHEVIIRHLRQLSTLGEKQNDPATVDLCGRRLNVHEKFAWMLRSQM